MGNVPCYDYSKYKAPEEEPKIERCLSKFQDKAQKASLDE